MASVLKELKEWMVVNGKFFQVYMIKKLATPNYSFSEKGTVAKKYLLLKKLFFRKKLY